jgi:carbon-monoxide dehydrogenase large subunit
VAVPLPLVAIERASIGQRDLLVGCVLNLEQAARELTAPVDLRRPNFIGPQAMPYRTPLLHTYDSGEFDKVLEKTLRLADCDGFAARKAESEHNGRLRGRAAAAFIELAAIGNERMEIRFDPSGTVTIIAPFDRML